MASKLPTASSWGVNTLRVLIGAVFDFLTEVQSQLNMPEMTAKSYFHRARLLLRTAATANAVLHLPSMHLCDSQQPPAQGL